MKDFVFYLLVGALAVLLTVDFVPDATRSSVYYCTTDYDCEQYWNY